MVRNGQHAYASKRYCHQIHDMGHNWRISLLFFLGDANGTVLATRYYWKLVNRNGQAVNSLEKEGGKT